jgi:erythromycin esterase
MHKLFLLIILNLFFQTTFAQKEISWLKNNIASINLDTTQIDNSQYESIKKSIGNARVVLLGEQTHGDGTTFETKVQLIKYLHEKMGFTVLAFESPLLDAEMAWLEVKANINPLYALQNSTFPHWGKTKELQPLFQYIISKRKSENPLTVSGFDCQIGGQFQDKYFIRNFIYYLNTKNIGFKNYAEKDSFLNVYNILNKGLYKSLYGKIGDGRKLFLDTFFLKKKVFSNLLNEKISQLSAINEKEANLYIQHLKNIESYLPEQYRLSRLDSTVSGVSSPTEYLRDSLMAENIIWLANKQYSDKKIIIWAASYHNA